MFDYGKKYLLKKADKLITIYGVFPCGQNGLNHNEYKIEVDGIQEKVSEPFLNILVESIPYEEKKIEVKEEVKNDYSIELVKEIVVEKKQINKEISKEPKKTVKKPVNKPTKKTK